MQGVLLRKSILIIGGAFVLLFLSLSFVREKIIISTANDDSAYYVVRTNRTRMLPRSEAVSVQGGGEDENSMSYQKGGRGAVTNEITEISQKKEIPLEKDRIYEVESILNETPPIGDAIHKAQLRLRQSAGQELQVQQNGAFSQGGHRVAERGDAEDQNISAGLSLQMAGAGGTDAAGGDCFLEGAPSGSPGVNVFAACGGLRPGICRTSPECIGSGLCFDVPFVGCQVPSCYGICKALNGEVDDAYIWDPITSMCACNR